MKDRTSTNKFKRHLITAALPYANGPLHIGHMAGAYLPADIYSRFLRSKGSDVLFVCGSDEHGAAITIRALKEGISPAELVDKYHFQFKKTFQKLGIAFDFYHRTSSELHHQTASDFFKNLHDQGILFEQENEQYFDEKHQQFLADRYITGTCPHCNYEKAYGDQCEKCGSDLSPKELINPQSVLSKSQPVLRKTTHWYFPLDKYEDWLNKWILEEHKDDWKTNVYGQCKSWLTQGLKARAFTRDLNWGVPVPLPEAKGKVLYVWVDAPVGYISATKAWAIDRAEKNPEKGYNASDWELYWKDPQTRMIHFIGKDNIVFHCILFPSMLKAHANFNLPDNVPANEFMNLEAEKISTSRNWGVWLDDYTERFKGKEDVLRYTLCANAPEAKDSDFSWNDFQLKNNSELVAIFGNFVHRITVLTHKYFNGIVPEYTQPTEQEEQLIKIIENTPANMEIALEKFKFREALTILMNMIRAGNKYLTDTEPWKAYKSEPDRAGTILHTGLQLIANITILCEPFLPFTSEKLKKIINFDTMKWDQGGKFDLIKSGHQINEAVMLFEKIEDKIIENEIMELKNSAVQNSNSEQANEKQSVDFEQFNKLSLETATIIHAEKVPKTKKLLKLELDLGYEKRTVVSGIADQYETENIIGKQVCIVANLEPRKIRGIESKGMILMAEDSKGNLTFVSPESKTEDGSRVK